MAARIPGGTLTLVTSGTAEAERDVAEDATVSALPALALVPTLPAGGADNDNVGSFGRVSDPDPPASLSVSTAAAAAAACWFAAVAAAAADASSESFSPTQDRANHRPPAMPRISRFAVRQ